jgi:hypothetical protein
MAALSFEYKVDSSVADPHHFDADPDLSFSL